MRLFALLLKEAQQHAAAVVGSVFLLGAFWLACLSFTLSVEQGTLLTAGTGFIYYGMPFAVMFVLRRLVVIEHEQHTHDFLAALPVSAWMLSGLKYVLGLAYVLVIGLFAVVFTALIVSRQELISARFLLQVCAQGSCYLFAWYGITWAAAHLGRYRFTFWMLLFAFMFTADQLDPSAWTEVLWHAALGEKLDVTRVATPWASMALSLGWGLGGTALGFFLATWQQGSVAASWYRPMDTQEKTTLVVIVVIAWLSIDVVEQFIEPGGPSYESLTDAASGESVVRVAGGERSPMWPLGQQLGDAMDEMVQHIGPTEIPTVVLVPINQEAEQLVKVRSGEHGELVLEVDTAGTTRQLLRRTLATVVAYRSAGLPALRADRAWVAAGTPHWLVGPDPEHPDVYPLRAAVAGSAGLTEADLADSLGIRLRFGPDVAKAVGWTGLAVVEQMAGRDAVYKLLDQILAPQSRPNLFAALKSDWRDGETRFRDATGLEPQAHRTAWLAALEAHAATHRHRVSHLVPRWGTLHRIESDEAEVTLVSNWEAAPPDGLQIAWWPLDPLHTSPVAGPAAEWKDADVDGAIDQVLTPVDGRKRVAMSFRLHIADLQGELWSGVEVDP